MKWPWPFSPPTLKGLPAADGYCASHVTGDAIIKTGAIMLLLFLRCNDTGHMYAGNISDSPTVMVPPLPSVSSHVLR